MSAPVVTKDPAAVAVEVQAAYLALFPDGDRLFVSRVFGWAIGRFTGGVEQSQGCWQQGGMPFVQS